MPGPRGDEQLLRATIREASPSRLDALRRDRRPWVRRIARAEDDRRTRECAEEVVCREPLRQLVVGFVASWNRERPPTGGQFGQNHREHTETAHVAAYDWLASESGLSRLTVEGVAHRGQRRSPVVAFDVADALVTALGVPEAMHDGTLPLTTRSSASCCSGGHTNAGVSSYAGRRTATTTT